MESSKALDLLTFTESRIGKFNSPMGDQITRSIRSSTLSISKPSDAEESDLAPCSVLQVRVSITKEQQYQYCNDSHTTSFISYQCFEQKRDTTLPTTQSKRGRKQDYQATTSSTHFFHHGITGSKTTLIGIQESALSKSLSGYLYFADQRERLRAH